MTRNKCEMKARKWIVQNGLADGAADILTVKPDNYIMSTREFIEVKTLQTPKRSAKRIYLDYGQFVQFERLNPLILVFDPDLDEPIWKGRFNTLIQTMSTLPFQISLFRKSYDYKWSQTEDTSWDNARKATKRNLFPPVKRGRPPKKR